MSSGGTKPPCSVSSCSKTGTFPLTIPDTYGNYAIEYYCKDHYKCERCGRRICLNNCYGCYDDCVYKCGKKSVFDSDDCYEYDTGCGDCHYHEDSNGCQERAEENCDEETKDRYVICDKCLKNIDTSLSGNYKTDSRDKKNIIYICKNCIEDQ